MVQKKDIRARLKDCKLKATSQRLAVYDAVSHLGHAGADTVAAYIKEQGTAAVSVSSVYNILTQFADLGICRRIPSLEGRMLFDANIAPHIDMYDTKNCVFRDIEDEEFTRLVESHFKKLKLRGYKLDEVKVQLICHSTRRKKV